MSPEPWAKLVSERALMLFLACLLSLVLGGPLRLHRFLGLDRPAAILRQSVLWLGRKFNRPQRGAATLRFRGLLMVLIWLGLAVALGALLDRQAWMPSLLPGILPEKAWLLIDLLSVAALLPMRSPLERAGHIRRAIASGQWRKGSVWLAKTAEGAAQPVDKHGMARAAVEALAAVICTRLAPVAFWYLLLGLPGAFAAAMLHLLAGLYRGTAFGRPAAALDRLGQAIPLRPACLLLLFAAFFVPKASPLGGLRAITAAETPTALLPEAAFAGVLRIALGGPRRFGGVTERREWVGQGSAMVEPAAILQAQYLHATATGLFLLAVCLINWRPHSGIVARAAGWLHHAVSSNLHAAF